MNLGLGYLFGARDRGLGRALKKTQGGVSRLNEGLLGIGATSKRSMGSLIDGSGRASKSISGATASLGRMNAAIGAFSINGLNNIEQKLDEIGSGNVNQLTSALQGQAIEFDKNFTKAAGSIGLFGAAAEAAERQAFKAAYGLNADMGVAQEAMLLLKKNKLEPSDLGLDSFESVVKAIETTGIEAKDLVGTVAALKKGYGMKEPGKFLDMMIQQSTALGLGADATSQMTQMLTDMDSVFAQTLKKETPEQIEATSKSMLQLAGAMSKTLGTDSAKSMETALNVFKTLSDEASAFPKMAAGLDAEFGPLIQSLAIDLPGGFQAAFDSMKKDPLTFAKKMADTYSKLGKAAAAGNTSAGASMQRLNAALEPLGPEFLHLVQTGDQFKAVVGDPNFAKGGSESLQKFANATYKTGLTLDDQIERAREGFKTRLFGFTEDRTRTFVKNQKDRYKDLGDAIGIAIGKVDLDKPIEKMTLLEKVAIKAKDNGFGPLIMDALTFARIGPAVFGDVLDIMNQIAPLLLGMHALGLNLGNLTAPLMWLASGIGAVATGFVGLVGWPVTLLLGIGAAIAAVVGGVFLLDKALAGDLGPTMQSFAVRANDMIGQVTDMGKAYLDAAIAAAPGIRDAALATGKQFITAIVDFYKSGGQASQISQAVREYFVGLDWSAVYEGMSESLRGMKAKGQAVVIGLIDDLTDFLHNADMVSIGETVGNLVANSLLNMLMNGALLGGILLQGIKMAGMYVLSGQVFEGIFDLALSSSALMRAISVAFVKLVLGAWLGAGKAALAAWSNIGSLFVTGIENTIQQAKDKFRDLWDGIYEGAFALFGNSINTMVAHDFGLIFDIIDTAKLWFTDLLAFVGGIFGGIGTTIVGAFDSVYAGVQSVFDKISAAFWAIWDQIKVGLSSVSGIMGVVGQFVTGGDRASPAPVADGGRAAAEAEASSRAKLFAQADIRSLMEVVMRVGEQTNALLEQVVENTALQPAPAAAPGQKSNARGSTPARTNM